MNKQLLKSICGLSLTTTFLFHSLTHGATLPKDWTEKQISDSEAQEEISKATEPQAQEFKGLVEMPGEALDKISEPPADPKKKWHLAGMVTGYGFGADVVLGPVTVSSEMAITHVWTHSGKKVKKTVITAATEKPQVLINPKTNDIELESKINPIIDAAVATEPDVPPLTPGNAGHYTAEEIARHNQISEDVKQQKSIRKKNMHGILKTVGHKLHNLSLALAMSSPTGWNVESFEYEVVLSATGEIAPMVSAGGFFRIVFFVNSQRGNVTLEQIRNDSYLSEEDKKQIFKYASFVGLIGRSATDAFREYQCLSQSKDQTIAAKYMNLTAIKNNTGFAFNEISMGIGFSADGEIGVASSSAEISAEMHLEKNDEFIPLTAIELAQNPSCDFKTTDGTEFNYSDRDDGKVDHKGHPFKRFFSKLAARHFRKGILRALKINAKVLQHSKIESKSKRWQLHAVKTGYSFGTGSTIGLASIGKTGSLAVYFEKEDE